jgi:uncharacterized protein YdaU (DUF1376 family)
MSRDRYGKILWVRLFRETMKGRVAGLSLEATGAYFRLFWAFIEHKGPLRDDERLLASIVQVSISKWRGIRKEMEDHCMYDIADGFVHDPIAAERIEHFQGKSHTNTQNIAKRWGDTPRAEDAS